MTIAEFMTVPKANTLALDVDTVAILRTCADGSNEPGCVIDRVLHRIHPYTRELREHAARMRGRGGFSYGKAVCVLPSAHFYRRRSIAEELELDGYRDEED